MGISTEDPQFIDNDGLSDDDVPEEAHKNLLKAVSQLYKKQRIEAPKRKEAAQVISEFNLSQNTEDGGNKILVNELLNDLKEKVTHKEITKKVKDAQKKSKTLPTPLEKNEAEKIYRKVGYENVKNKLDQWNTIVERNRLASQLTFPLQQKEPQKEPVNFLKTFEKPTELEKAMAAVLSQSEVAQEERKLEDELSQLSIGEMIERRRMMAKMKARESYRIAKAVRQNKIKSKKYRRILKKERIKQEMLNFEKLQKTDPEAALEKLAQLERARAEERISLRHRNTGKWAKSQAVRAKYNPEVRIQLSEQLAKSRELTRKIRNNESSDDEVESVGEESDAEMNAELPQKANLNQTQNPANPWFNNEYESFLKGCNEFIKKTSENPGSKESIINNSTTEVTQAVTEVTQAVTDSHDTAKKDANLIDVEMTQNSESNVPNDDSESIAKLNNEEIIKDDPLDNSLANEKSKSKENNFEQEQLHETGSAKSQTNEILEKKVDENSPNKENNISTLSVSEEDLASSVSVNDDVDKINVSLTPKKSLKISIPVKEKIQTSSPQTKPVVKSDGDINSDSTQINVYLSEKNDNKLLNDSDGKSPAFVMKKQKNLIQIFYKTKFFSATENSSPKDKPVAKFDVDTNAESINIDKDLSEEEDIQMLNESKEKSSKVNKKKPIVEPNSDSNAESVHIDEVLSEEEDIQMLSESKEKSDKFAKKKPTVELESDTNAEYIQINEEISEKEDDQSLRGSGKKIPPKISKKRKKTLITNCGAWDVVDYGPVKKKNVLFDGPAKKKKKVDKVDGSPAKNKNKAVSASPKSKEESKRKTKKKLKEKSLADLFDDAQEAIKNHTLKAAMQMKTDLEKYKEDNVNNIQSDADISNKRKEQNYKPRGIDEALVEIHEEGISSGTNDLKMLKDKLSGVEQVQEKEPQIDPTKHINVKPQKLFSEIGDVEEEGDDDSDNNEGNQRLHLMEAFADDDIADEFRKEKDEEAKKNKAQEINLSLPGWGTWGGTSIKPRTIRKHRRMMIRLPKVPRKDDNKPTVIINEDTVPKLREQLVSELPYPFTSVKEFEATIRAPIGKHWIPERAHRKLTAPPVRTKMGTIITPMSDDVAISKPKKRKRITRRE